MRKILLITALLASTAAGAAAQPSEGWSRLERQARVAPLADDDDSPYVVFGYCNGYETGVGQYGNLQGAMEIPAETAVKFKGNSLTRIRVGIGTCSSDSITLFLTDNLNGKSFYTQKVKIQKKDGWNEFTLDEPYEITGEGFFIGYSYPNCRQGEYPIGIDNVPTDKLLGDYIAVGTNWEHIGSMFGCISIQAVIEGDSLALYDVEITDLQLPSFVKPGTPFSATARIVNNGVVTVEKIALEAIVGGVSTEVADLVLRPSKVPPGESGTLTVNGLVASAEGLGLDVALRVTAVNGESDANAADNIAEGSVASFNDGFHRNIVVEEWTGTWCGWCVRGIVGMNYMKETYGDDGFIGIAVHGNNGNVKDSMTVPSYNDFLNTFAIIGFPGCVVNRKYSLDPNREDLEYIYKALATDDTYVRVSDLTAEYNADEPLLLSVGASVDFAVDGDGLDHRLAFVITEDNYGPGYQSNYYAGGQYGAMDGWEKKSMTVIWYFDEVARDITDCFGIEGSLPSSVEKGTSYTYATDLPLDNVEILANCELTALILDGNTGEVVNAARVSLHETGVEAPAVDDSSAPAEYYTLDGRRVANPDRGIFIRKAGGKAVKVVM